MIPQNFIQEIVDKTDIIELIGGYLALKKSGANHWARCPFHNEKTPSFSVNAVKNVYHCFGCGAHGNAIGFLMDHQGLNFIEAVSDLAGRLGLDVPSDQNKNAHSIDTIKELEWVLQKSLLFYKEELKKSQPAINFLKARGLTGSVAGSFNLGFAPNKINALKFYKKELRKYPHSRSTKGVETLARFRGISCGVNYAEGFYLNRLVE